MKVLLNQYGDPLPTTNKSTTQQSLMAFSNGKRLFMDVGTNNFYSKNSVVFRGIDLLASLGASLPFQIYNNNKLIDGDFDNRFNLNYPNPDVSFNELMYKCLINYFYFGEAFIHIDLDLMVLSVINPKHMTRYNNVWRQSSTTVNRILADEELVYIKRYNPDNTLDCDVDRGLSIIDVIREDLVNDVAAQRYNTKYFENFGKIGGFFTTDDITTPGQMDSLAKQYAQIHSGVDNAYKALVLPAGIKYQELAQTMREMEYIESRKDVRDKVLLALGIHKAMLGATDTANRSVTEEAVRTVWLHTLKPVLTMFQEKLNQQLFRRYFPKYLMYWDYSGVQELRESKDSLLSQAERLRNLGYTINEINTFLDLGMPEVTDPVGDMRMVPSSFIPVDSLIIEDEPVVVTPKDDSGDDLGKFFTTDTKKVVSVSRYIKEHSKLTSAYEKKFAGKVGKFLSTELGKVLKYVYSIDKNKSGIDTVTMLLGILSILNTNKEVLVNIVQPMYNEISEEADSLAIKTLAVEEEPAASTVVVASMVNNIKNISNHTYRMIRTQVVNGVESGATIDEIADGIKSVYKTSSARARIIARTEVNGVVNRTSDERYRAAGVTKKKWVSTSDKDTRDTHKYNSKLGVVDYDFVYPNGQKFPNDSRGGASENVACRCTIAPIST